MSDGNRFNEQIINCKFLIFNYIQLKLRTAGIFVFLKA